MRGIGTGTAAWLLVTTLNGTGATTPESLVAYAGFAPLPHGPGGNSRLGTALYLAPLRAAHHNPAITTGANCVRTAGTPMTVARCAAARKLLHIAWAVVTKKQPVDPTYGAHACDTGA